MAPVTDISQSNFTALTFAASERDKSAVPDSSWHVAYLAGRNTNVRYRTVNCPQKGVIMRLNLHVALCTGRGSRVLQVTEAEPHDWRSVIFD
jgi:hypothetical protein